MRVAGRGREIRRRRRYRCGGRWLVGIDNCRRCRPIRVRNSGEQSVAKSLRELRYIRGSLPCAILVPCAILLHASHLAHRREASPRRRDACHIAEHPRPLPGGGAHRCKQLCRSNHSASSRNRDTLVSLKVTQLESLPKAFSRTVTWKFVGDLRMCLHARTLCIRLCETV